MSIAQSIKHQDRLLTINIKEGEIQNALPGVHVTPCFLDPDNGKWIIYARFDAGVVMPRHFHTGVVHFYTTAGSWHYVEYPKMFKLPVAIYSNQLALSIPYQPLKVLKASSLLKGPT